MIRQEHTFYDNFKRGGGGISTSFPLEGFGE